MHDLTVTTPGPHTDFKKPRITLPVGSCDAHVHLFGPHDRFPFAPERTFTPPDVPLETLRQLHETMGFSRSVLVQSACHGGDHSVLFDALERGQGAYRAVALLGPETTIEDIRTMDAAGFCGARVHFAPHLGAPPTREELRRLVDLIGPFGWHLEVHTMGAGILDFAEIADAVTIRVVVDHMARFVLPDGDVPGAYSATVDLLHGDDVWIKLSGVDRVSREFPSMADGLALARRFFLARPDRCLWGSDFPHPNTQGFMPWDHDLVNGIETIAPTDSERRQLLVRNPEVCFGFGPA
ncbi:amidohydrolase family protein [Arthrobacter sp.]|uniref:amidohydrolase family protein n=1 Tax=Arthrobacter sp. TaxID=1667 RepID=UPI003A8DE48A